MNEKTEKNIEEEGNFTEDYRFLFKPNFSLLVSKVDVSRTEPIKSFVQGDEIRDVLGLDTFVLHEKYNLSLNPVDILSVDNFFEIDIAQGMIFKGERPGRFHKNTIAVNKGYSYMEKIRGGFDWYMMGSKNFISNITL